MEKLIDSSRDTLLFAIPMLGILAVSVFGLEEKIFRSRKPTTRGRKAVRLNSSEQTVLIDPDGRPVAQPRRG